MQVWSNHLQRMIFRRFQSPMKYAHQSKIYIRLFSKPKSHHADPSEDSVDIILGYSLFSLRLYMGSELQEIRRGSLSLWIEEASCVMKSLKNSLRLHSLSQDMNILVLSSS